MNPEQSAHEAFKALAETIWKETGIAVRDVSFDWLDIASLSNRNLTVTKVSMSTMTQP